MSETKKLPERTCVVCKAHLPKQQLIRIVKTKENKFVVDNSGKTEGRGIYLCAKPECVAKAKKTRVISKIFKVETPLSLYEEIESKLND